MDETTPKEEYGMEEKEQQAPPEPMAPADPYRMGQMPAYGPPPPVTYLQEGIAGTYLPYGMPDETVLEKKAIRKSANTIGSSLLLTELFILVWALLYLFITARLGLSREMAVSLVNNPFMEQVLQIVLSSIAFLVPALLIFKIREKSISDIVPFSAPKKGTVFPMFLFGMSFCMFANIATSLFQQFFKEFGIEYHVPQSENPTGAIGVCLVILANCVFPAFLEEFIFRGLVLGSLRKYGEGFAVLASSILFGLIHGNFEQIPFAFLVGLVLGFLVIQTGSLWVGIAVHAGNNFISILFTYFLEGLPNETTNLIYIILLILLMATGVLALLITANRKGGFSLQKADMKTKEKGKYKWFFLSPFVLLLIAYNLFSAIEALWEEIV